MVDINWITSVVDGSDKSSVGGYLIGGSIGVQIAIITTIYIHSS
jgi:hypothetical protein